ncbi:hypothetical protein CMI47_02680 [Candidatus Pacearchaeota archaeon]|jgi:hypothetical protein|nr:hypothetical protein [Candidatus Pacearchaeota archaeon]
MSNKVDPFKERPNKHFIISGCSFTLGNGTWPYHINQDKYGWVLNVGDTGAGNGYISRSIIWEVNNQIKLGKDPKDIEVIIMWSGITRKEFLSTVRENPLHELWVDGPHKNWMGNFIHDEGWDRHPEEDSTWIKSSIPYMDWNNKSVTKFLDLYWKHFYSEEESLINTFESILRVQWYLDGLGIKYTMMCWQNIFNQYSFKVPSGWARQEGDEIFGHEIWNLAWRDNTHFKEDRYWPDNATEKISKDTPLLKDLYPNATYLWDMIDWDKWWFYEDEQVEYGGLAEWVCLEARDPWGNGEHDPGHPSPLSHKKFCEQVIISILEDKV